MGPLIPKSADIFLDMIDESFSGVLGKALAGFLMKSLKSHR